jgi:diaminopimelate decarboxylase
MYSPPTITGELGRSDAFVARNFHNFQNRATPVCDSIDNVNVSELVENFGSPLFVFSERKVIETARRARKAFNDVCPGTVFGWSYKTNYLKAICNIFHKEGWIAEVVSEFEYQKAEQAGIPGKDIIYNGPCKSRESLEHALKRGSLVQIDHWDELKMVEEISATMRRRVDVGIRIWMDTNFAPVWAKFGFAFDNGEASRAIMRVVSNPCLRLHTLHTHIGTYILEPKAYAVASERLVALRQLLYKNTGHLVPCINLGGGFPSSGLLHGQPENTKVPPIEDYAAAIADVLNRLPRKQRPQLRLETGRHLIDDAGYLITSVVAVKGSDRDQAKTGRGKHSRGSYIVDAGVNLLYTSTWFKLGVMPTMATPPLHTDTVKLYGCLCMNIDVIREEVELPPLEVSDKLVLHPVGAYNLTQSMQFIGLRPAVVLIGVDGSVNVIRRREKLIDIEIGEQVPAYLQLKTAPINKLAAANSKKHARRRVP